MADFFLPVDKSAYGVAGKGRKERRKSQAASSGKRPDKRKRGRGHKNDSRGGKRARGLGRSGRAADEDEELESGDSESDGDDARVRYDLDGSSSSGDAENAAERRARLAREYLSRMDDDLGSGSSDDGTGGVGPDRVGHALRQDALRASGRFQQSVWERVLDADFGETTQYHRKHKLPVTCVAVSADDHEVYSGGKDCCVVRWDVETDTRTVLRGFRGDASLGGHTDHVLAVAASDDGRYLASGGHDGNVRVWDLRTNETAVSFDGHRGSVTGLAFRRRTLDLYSGGTDRVVKLWNVAEMAYVETLFGHETDVMAIDALSRERILSAGADRTARVWKIVERKHFVYSSASAHTQSIETAQLINENSFIAGGQSGAVSLWQLAKKKPTCVVQGAHLAPHQDPATVLPGQRPWITAVAALRFTDLVASASSTGLIKLWGINSHRTQLSLANEIPIEGFVNGLAFANSGRFIVAAVGQEHRMGRWWRNRKARNAVRLWRLPIDTATVEVEEE